MKGLPYEYVSVGALPPHRFREINPQGLMPAVEVDGRIVAQSTQSSNGWKKRIPNLPSCRPILGQERRLDPLRNSSRATFIPSTSVAFAST
jgi:hypothetical protein